MYCTARSSWHTFDSHGGFWLKAPLHLADMLRATRESLGHLEHVEWWHGSAVASPSAHWAAQTWFLLSFLLSYSSWFQEVIVVLPKVLVQTEGKQVMRKVMLWKRKPATKKCRGRVLTCIDTFNKYAPVLAGFQTSAQLVLPNEVIARLDQLSLVRLCWTFCTISSYWCFMLSANSQTGQPSLQPLLFSSTFTSPLVRADVPAKQQETLQRVGRNNKGTTWMTWMTM